MAKKQGPHPRKEPRIPGELSLERVKEVFSHCADFVCREVAVGESTIYIGYLVGMVKSERLNDYVIRPMLSGLFQGRVDLTTLKERVIWAGSVQERDQLDAVVQDIIVGGCVLFLEEGRTALTVPVPTEDRRSVGQPDNEPALKGSRESFTETMRVNTAMLRRHLRAPELQIEEHIVGRQSLTPVDVVYLRGIADEEVVRKIRRRLEEMDLDGMEAAGNLEEYLVDGVVSPFPRLCYTQRPDRLCQSLLEGRVGILVEGIPLAWWGPATLDEFFTTGQDRAYHWTVASCLRLLRYVCAVVSILLPGLYTALVTFHPEAIPARLALSIVAAKQEVPFSTIFEVLILLLAFEIVQEAGLRLPGPIGSTVSILGGLVVGNAAVEAHIISPAVLIVVAAAGIAGYTQPSQDFGNALRLWRFLLSVLGSVGGIFGLSAGLAALIYHLATLESFGVPYLAPFTNGAGAPQGHPSLIRLPLPWMKWRQATPMGKNRRNQK